MTTAAAKGPYVADLHRTHKQGGRTYAYIHGRQRGVVPLAAVVLGVEGMSDHEGRATALLLAASWTMLEALEALVSSAECGAPDTDPIHPRLWRQAKAAIAAAKGGEQ